MRREILPTVLIVDDESLICWALAEALSAEGYSTVQASTGAEAQRRLTESGDAPLVVLLDLRLPDVHDLSLAKAVRRLRPDARLIIMTAHGTAEDAAEARGIGAVDFIIKPFDMPAIMSAVDRAWRTAAGGDGDISQQAR